MCGCGGGIILYACVALSFFTFGKNSMRVHRKVLSVTQKAMFTQFILGNFYHFFLHKLPMSQESNFLVE